MYTDTGTNLVLLSLGTGTGTACRNHTNVTTYSTTFHRPFIADPEKKRYRKNLNLRANVVRVLLHPSEPYFQGTI